ncbi:MAG TPA: hypothetical protein HPP87_03685 [Planctomycetes bacterium]|nr:hypothetical protein [Planctomycetota bacterium]
MKIDNLKKLAACVWLICLVVLSATGFGPWLVLHKRLTGYWLMVHVTFAPVFALCTAVLAVMYAHNLSFDKSDRLFLLRIFRRRKPYEEFVGNGSVIVMKVCFWLICVSALPLFLSSVLSMFPLFGTEGQEIMFQTHRYSALLLSLFGILYTYLLIRTLLQKR